MQRLALLNAHYAFQGTFFLPKLCGTMIRYPMNNMSYCTPILSRMLQKGSNSEKQPWCVLDHPVMMCSFIGCCLSHPFYSWACHRHYLDHLNNLEAKIGCISF